MTRSTRIRSAAVPVVSPVPRAVWREVMAADPDAVATQAPEWMDCLAGRGYTDRSKLYVLPDGRRLVLPVAARSVSGFTVTQQSWAYGWGYGGALVEGGALDAASCRLVLDDLARSRALLGGITPMPLRGAVWDAAAGPAVERVRYTSQVIDLADGWDALWTKKFRRQARNSVRKAERFELDIRREEGPDARGVALFADLYGQSVDRWAAQRGQPLAIARRLAARRDRPGQVAAAARALGGRCVVWSVLRGGEPVAVNVILATAHHAIGWMCAMDERLARETLATYLIHSLSLQDACERGIRWFHMGESDAGSGSEHFKKYFGAVPCEYAALRLERLPFARAERGARAAYGALSSAQASLRERIAARKAQS
jgi:GNAT acetyltransferase-like protein